MKILLVLTILLGVETAQAVPRILDADIVRGIKSVQNYVKNPEFETNIANVTDGGAGIISWSNVSPVDNTGSLVINSLLSGQVVKITTKAQQKKLEGQTCYAELSYTGDATNYKAYVLNGVTNVSGDFPLDDAGVVAIHKVIPFPCQSVGDTVDVAIESTAITAGAIKIDSAFVGESEHSFLPGYTAGSVLFADGSKIAQDNANLFWDDASNRLGIGNAAPSQALDVTGNFQVSGSAQAGGVLRSLSALELQDPGAGTNTVTMQAVNPLAASYALTLPVDDGTANQVLATDGSGVLSWVNRVINTGDTMTGNLVMSNTGTASEVRFAEDTGNGANYAAVKAPSALAANYTLTLPADDGTAGDVLSTDGSGGLSWVAPGAGTGVPAGTIVPYVGTSAPAGWLLCDGSTVNRVTYATLYAVVGDAFGNGDGSTTFHLPDLRGRFLRGRDGGAGNDPDAGSRTAINSGGNTGDAVGSLQDDAFESHTHGYYGNQSGAFTFNLAAGGLGAQLSTSATGGNETRPKNVYVNYIIKY